MNDRGVGWLAALIALAVFAYPVVDGCTNEEKDPTPCIAELPEGGSVNLCGE